MLTIRAEFDGSLYCDDDTKADFRDDRYFEWEVGDVVYGVRCMTVDYGWGPMSMTAKQETKVVSVDHDDKSKATLEVSGISEEMPLIGAFIYGTENATTVSPDGVSGFSIDSKNYGAGEGVNKIDRNIVMIATITEDITDAESLKDLTLQFKPATGLFKFTYKNIPSDAAKFVIKTAVHEGDKPYENLTNCSGGSFDRTGMKGLGGKEQLTKYESNGKYTITFNAGVDTELDFYVPAPEGTYSAGLTVELQDASGNTIEGTKKTTVQDIVVKNAYLVPVKPIVL